jgi:hypothetical protein
VTNRGAMQSGGVFFCFFLPNKKLEEEKRKGTGFHFFFYGVRRKDDTEKKSKVFELFERCSRIFVRKKAQAGSAATATRGRFFCFTISQGTDNHRQ